MVFPAKGEKQQKCEVGVLGGWLGEIPIPQTTVFGAGILSGETELGSSFATSLVAGVTEHKTKFSPGSVMQIACLSWASVPTL